MAKPKIKVLGIGGSGCNTVSRMAKDRLKGVELIALNTDAQVLDSCSVRKKILIGRNITGGLGAGMDVSLGEKAAQESKNRIKDVLKGADMVFITSGMGGGTGSPTAPVVAGIAKNLGILTVATVTTPFSFEGAQRKKVATEALKKLKGKVDTLLIIPNDKLLSQIDEETTVSEAFLTCDDVLRQAVQGITDLVAVPGIINVDFSDVKTIMKNSGRALFGIGTAKGEERAIKAAKRAINSPLLDFSIEGAGGILFNVSGKNISLAEIREAAELITEQADKKAEIIFGAIEKRSLKKNEIKITVIATGF